MADYSKLYRETNKLVYNNPELRRAYKALINNINAGKASYNEAIRFSEKLASHISAEILGAFEGVPETDLAEFARKFVLPLYETGQKEVIRISDKIQAQILKNAGIGLKTADVAPDISRLANIAKRFEEAVKKPEIAFLCDRGVVENIMRSSVTDVIGRNADKLEKAGADVVLIRRTNGKCCDWCESVSGSFVKGEEPEGFWRVHKDCTCSIEYRCQFTGTRTKIRFSTDKGNLSKIEEDI